MNNPQELGMVWMGYAPDRSMILDDTSNLTNFYGQTAVTAINSSISNNPILDDLTQQAQLDMNGTITGMISDYTGHMTTTPVATTPAEIFALQQQHAAQLGLGNYNLVNSLSHQLIDEDDDDDGMMNDNGHDSNDMLEKIDDDNDDDQNHLIAGDIVDLQQIQLQQQYQQYGYAQDSLLGTTQDDNSGDYDNGNSDYLLNTYMTTEIPHQRVLASKSTTIATQTSHHQQIGGKEHYRKIKPVKRPGLVLKTPIAYQGNIDPSVIPIQRDGMAVCEKCGAIGVKHSFYTKQRRFCSMACARENYGTNQTGPVNNSGNNSTTQHQQNHPPIKLEIFDHQLQQVQTMNTNYRFKMSNVDMENIKTEKQPMLYRDVMPQDDCVPQIPKISRLPSPCPQDDRIQTIRRKPSEFANSYDWTPQLSMNFTFCAAPVTCFRHAPGFDMWPNIVTGMKVEVENTDCDSHSGLAMGNTPHLFFVATVLRICGYKALLRYEGFDENRSHDFWVNLCSSEVHPVGWCATRGKPLIPPKSIEKKYSDWKDFLVKRLSGARTLPSTFYNKISDSFKSRFRCGLQLEVVDKNRISQVRVATINKIVGKRLYVRYFNSPPDDNGFWCHEDSPLIHPVGWATTVGHILEAPPEYEERMNAHDQILEPHEDDATLDLFKTNFTFEEYYLDGKTSGFVEGMKLEAVDPLNLSSICVATVMEVLKFGYMMIRIDSYDPDATGADWFCYHEKSPSIFPVGFCQSNNIPLTPPKGYDSVSFNWEQYIEDSGCIPASPDLFLQEQPAHRFKVGMKLECADLMDPRLVCVATISRVVSRLLKVHFDGWEDEYDQWLDCASPDMYPLGWCILVGHKLEGPRILPKLQIPPKISPKVKRKQRRRKGGKLEPMHAGGGMKVTPLTRTVTVKKEQEQFELQKKQQPFRQHLKPEHDMDEDDYDDNYDDGISRSTSNANAEDDPLFQSDDELDSFGQRSNTDSRLSSNVEPEEQHFSEDSTNTCTTTVATTTLMTTTTTSSSSSPAAGGSSKLMPAIPATKYIPRLTLSSMQKSPESQKNGNTSANSTSSAAINPDQWSTEDVKEFLTLNDCQQHCDSFNSQNIDGRRLLQLTKDDIIELLGMKVGPALKIYDLIQQLKNKANPNQTRSGLKGSFNKKML